MAEVTEALCCGGTWDQPQPVDPEKKRRCSGLLAEPSVNSSPELLVGQGDQRGARGLDAGDGKYSPTSLSEMLRWWLGRDLDKREHQDL